MIHSHRPTCGQHVFFDDPWRKPAKKRKKVQKKSKKSNLDYNSFFNEFYILRKNDSLSKLPLYENRDLRTRNRTEGAIQRRKFSKNSEKSPKTRTWTPLRPKKCTLSWIDHCSKSCQLVEPKRGILVPGRSQDWQDQRVSMVSLIG